jgi:hypothetical protein
VEVGDKGEERGGDVEGVGEGGHEKERGGRGEGISSEGQGE